MANEHFNAVLAKNGLANHIGGFSKQLKMEVNAPYILRRLEIIEKYIGCLNQPNVKDSFTEGLGWETL